MTLKKLLYLKIFYMGLLTLFCFLLPNVVKASQPVKIVFLNFTDNTSYRDLHVSEVMDELLLERLFGANKFVLMEHCNDEDVIIAESKFNFTSDYLYNAVDNKDFATVFQASENDISDKMEGEYLDADSTKVIGRRNGAEYLLHGSIDELFVENDFMILPLKDYIFTNKSHELVAYATVRIIHADTGKIVWARKEKGVSKESLHSLQNITVGTTKFSNQMFYEALDKICKKVVKDLVKDLKKGKLVLSASN